MQNWRKVESIIRQTTYLNRYNPIWVLIFPVAVWAGCKDKEAPAQIVPEVNVVAAGQETVPVYVEYVGQTFGKPDVDIQPRTQGWVEGIHFKEGSDVKKGQLLYVLQDDELREKQQEAEAQLTQARVLLIKAKADLDRVKPLTEMNALSKRDLDAAQATYDAQRESVTAAEAGLKNAQIRLGYTRIEAPISGTIGVSKVQVGDYVKAVAEGPINTISEIDEMRVRFSITESDYLAFRRRMSAANLQSLEMELRLNDGSVVPEKARLDFANREVDPTTGSLLVQALVDNKAHLLRPGQYVKVRFKSDEILNAVLVPQQAINQLQNIYVIYLLNDSNRIEPRTVETGMRVGSNWVVTKGLRVGEKVALLGNAVIKPGMEIKPVTKPYSYDSTSIQK